MAHDQYYAVTLFDLKYGKKPEDAGYPVNDYYEEKNLYLYSDSKEAIDAFKSYQNVLAWLLKYFFGLLVLCLGIAALVVYEIGATLLTFACVGCGICVLFAIVLVVLAIYCNKQNKKIKGHPLLLIRYETADDDD